MTALLITLAVSLVLFLVSLVAGMLQTSDADRYYRYLMGTDEKTSVHTYFGRAARRPARILGTFIL